ncbi:MAG: Omp28 family outer membrane lipoprotein [Bacteroidetes bacterium]|nr:Omp28 family outer membrane lipoprotein [Bacteroidota bacterium]
MRNTVLLFIAAATFAACDYIDQPFRNPGGGGTGTANGDTVIQTERAVLVEDFTGHQCKNCPKASKVLKQLDSLYGPSKVVGLAIHAGPANFTATSAEYPTDFTTADGDDLADVFGVFALPLGMVNRLDFPTNTHLKSYSSWGGLAATQLAQSPEVLFSAFSGFDSTSRVATLRLEVRSQVAQANAVGVAVYLKESGIVSPQLMPDQTRDTNYVHYNVFRRAPWGPFGQEVWAAGAATSTATATLDASTTLEASWNARHMKWVAIAFDKATNRVLQAVQIDVK